jgi:hypothetical protein
VYSADPLRQKEILKSPVAQSPSEPAAALSIFREFSAQQRWKARQPFPVC